MDKIITIVAEQIPIFDPEYAFGYCMTATLGEFSSTKIVIKLRNGREFVPIERVEGAEVKKQLIDVLVHL